MNPERDIKALKNLIVNGGLTKGKLQNHLFRLTKAYYIEDKDYIALVNLINSFGIPQ
tara:strand:+ start:291 stop:461 length:171 start_codon:yes stop_codon:yes gene_type:complete